MKRQKKNSIFTFIFSWMPGAAEMYTGYMKTGLSLLSIFAAGCLIPSLMHASDVWILLPMVLYTYSFFHARNIASLNDEEISRLEDHFIWDEFTDDRGSVLSSAVLRKWGAVILIILGILALWSNFRSCILDILPKKIVSMLYPVIDVIPSSVFAILIIIIGIRLIQGKKKELTEAVSSAKMYEAASSDGTFEAGSFTEADGSSFSETKMISFSNEQNDASPSADQADIAAGEE